MIILQSVEKKKEIVCHKNIHSYRVFLLEQNFTLTLKKIYISCFVAVTEKVSNHDTKALFQMSDQTTLKFKVETLCFMWRNYILLFDLMHTEQDNDLSLNLTGLRTKYMGSRQ